MLIPAIDLMGGKIVQLIQGTTKALEFDDADFWIERFARHPLVHVIDLDAAMGVGENRSSIKHLCARLRCQVGGGIRSVGTAQELLAAGAQRVIIGSALVSDGALNLPFARDLAETVGTDHLVFALDSRNGKVVVQGWRAQTDYAPLDMIRSFEPFCGTFLYTHVDTEGLMTGIPRDVVRTLREATSKALLVAGGIASLEEVEDLDRLGIDAVVGMAIYTGRLDAHPLVDSIHSSSTEGWPSTRTTFTSRHEFIESVLRLSPRVVAFDCDGTLWPGDAGQEFFYWEIEQGVLSGDVAALALSRYADYLKGAVTEEAICGEMVTIHEGLLHRDLEAIGRDFVQRFVAPRVHPEMAELVKRLRVQAADVWLVSSTNQWVIGAAAELLGISASHVIAASAAVTNSRITSRLTRMPTGQSKADCFRELAGNNLDVAFGNSEHDASLLGLARCAYAISPTSKLLRMAHRHGWRVYSPGSKRENT